MTKPVNLFRNVYSFAVLSAILCFSSNACSGHQEPKYDIKSMAERYEAWLKKYERRYADRDEWNMCFGIYQSNIQFIDFINTQDLPYKLADNQFAYMTNQEFRAKYLGYMRNYNNTHPKYSNSTLGHHKAPTSVDWRKKGVVSPVRDHGECGSCWAFAEIASIEAITQIKTCKLLDLSEQAVIDCNTENEGCDMGYPTTAYEFIIKNGGIPAEKTYPYTGKKGNCNPTRIDDSPRILREPPRIPQNQNTHSNNPKNQSFQQLSIYPCLPAMHPVLSPPTPALGSPPNFPTISLIISETPSIILSSHISPIKVP